MFHLLSLLGGVFHHVVAERMIVYASCFILPILFFNHWLLDLTTGMLVSCQLSQSVLISNSSAEKLTI